MNKSIDNSIKTIEKTIHDLKLHLAYLRGLKQDGREIIEPDVPYVGRDGKKWTVGKPKRQRKGASR